MSSTVTRAASPSSSRSAVDEPVEPDAARGLDQDDVAVAQPRPEGVERRLGVRHVRGSGRVEPGLDRPVGDATGAPAPTTISSSATAAAASPTAWCPLSWASPSSSISPRTATRRPGSPASRSSAAVDRAGRRVVAVVDDGQRRAAGRARPGAGRAQPPARPPTMVSRSRPGREPDRRGGRRVVDRQPTERRDRDRPARPPASAAGSACPPCPAERDVGRADVGRVGEAVAHAPGRPCAGPCRVTIGSSALSTAVPSAGSASSSSPLARSTASSVPMRDRWTGWTAVTTPIDGRAIAARSAISPDTYMPISRTAASCSGPEAQERQRQADLVVLVALALERPHGPHRGPSRPPPSSRSWRCCR